MVPTDPKTDYSSRIIGIARYYAKVLEDVMAGIIGFIPNGLEQLYDYGLKPLPLWGRFFRHRWLEPTLKLATGITIGQGLAADLGRFVFGPVGFLFGALVGSMSAKEVHIPKYKGTIQKWLYELAGFVHGGLFLGGFTVCLAFRFLPSIKSYSFSKALVWGALVGAGIGLLGYLMYFFASRELEQQQNDTFKRRIHLAKMLGLKLRDLAKQNAKGRIFIYAQDIIQQMNGSQAQIHLAKFFNDEVDVITQSTNQKIDRHFQYLTDKASHGDPKALIKLQALIHRKGELDALLERLFHARAVAKIKDEVDTYFDRWYYHFLRGEDKRVSHAL